MNDGGLSARDVDGDKSVSLLGDDDDNTLTLEVQSPKVIDLTQSQSVVECDSFQKNDKPVTTLHFPLMLYHHPVGYIPPQLVLLG